jgi:transcriptional regulator with XRE-family HTH domain
VSQRARPAVPYGPTGHAVAANVKRFRELRGLSIYALSDALKEAGRPITPSAVAKIEKQQRQVTVDDLAALAHALGVPPQRMLEAESSCGTCHGAPPPGFACTNCGTPA